MLDEKQIRALCPGWPGSAPRVPPQQPSNDAGTSDMGGPAEHRKKGSKDT